MAILKSPKIFINGSTNAFGGYVYNASFNHQYGQSPSTLSLSIISKSREYLPVKLSNSIPYIIQFGDEIKLKMYAVSWKVTDGPDGKILNVNFQDGRFKMELILIKPPDFRCFSNNILKIGTIYNSSVTNGNQASTDGSQTYFSYDYSLLQGASPIKLPDIPNVTIVFRLNSEASLGQVFSEFCTAYGFTWYWDYDNEVPILLDLRTDVDLDPTLYSRLKLLPCLKSLSFGESLEGLEAQGAVFYNNNADSNIVATGPIFPVHNIFDEQFILSHKLFGADDKEAAIMAVWGEEVYFNYLFEKYSLDITKAFEILGYDLVTINSFNNMTAAQQEGVQNKSNGNDDYVNTARIARLKSRNDQNTTKAAHFRMADALKRGQIGWVITPFAFTSSSYQINEVDESGLISQIPGIGDFIATPTEQYDSFNNPDTIASRTTGHFFVVTFPKLKFLFDGFDTNVPPTLPLPATSPSSTGSTFQFKVEPISDGWQLDPDADQQDVFFLLTGTPEPSPKPRVDGLVGYIFGDPPSLSSNSFLFLANSFSSKYKSTLCNIPKTNDLVLSFKLITMTNDGILNPYAAVANSVILPKKPHQTFDAEIYGINTGLGLTPQKGLDGFSISMGDAGYETTYNLSSKKRIPLDNKIANTIYI